MPVYTDQLNRILSLSFPPNRIVSLVPSQTELLYHLGLENKVVGITKFCVHPEQWFRTKARIGGTKDVNLEKVTALQPDLIIANKEENNREQVEALAERFPVWVSDVNTLTDACQMISSLAEITDTVARGTQLVQAIKSAFDSLALPDRKPRTAYLIWKDPYMTAGGDTFIHAMLEQAGFDNLFSSTRRYPVVTLPAIKEAGCEVLLLSSEPYPFGQKHVEEISRLLPQTVVLLVDGETFSWYGSRLLQAPSYFGHLQNKVAQLL